MFKQIDFDINRPFIYIASVLRSNGKWYRLTITFEIRHFGHCVIKYSVSDLGDD
jgi:hypothetical protein